MRIADKFTPEVLVEAPRRGPAIPNHDGTKALYTLSAHTIGGGTLKEARVIDVGTGASRLLTNSSRAHDFAWLGAGSISYLESGDKGATELRVSDVKWDKEGDGISQASHRVAEFPAPVGHLKLKALGDGSFALAVVGRVDSGGKLFNEETEDVKSSARVYDNFNVRLVSVFSASSSTPLRPLGFAAGPLQSMWDVYLIFSQLGYLCHALLHSPSPHSYSPYRTVGCVPQAPEIHNLVLSAYQVAASSFSIPALCGHRGWTMGPGGPFEKSSPA